MTPTGTGNRWPSSCGQAMSARTPPPTISRRPGSRSRSSPGICTRRVLVRADSGGGTHEFLTWLTARSRRLHYSIGMTITEAVAEAIGKIPADAWTAAYDGDGQVRDGAWVADITGLLDLDEWPAGMRVIVRKERPHPGRSYGSPTSTGTGSPPSPPAPAKGSSLTWSCASGGGPGARNDPRREGHRAPEPAARRGSRGTRSGARSSRWTASYWPGPRCSP